MDKLLTPQEVDVLVDTITNIKGRSSFLAKVKDVFNDRYLYVKNHDFFPYFSLNEQADYAKTNVFTLCENLGERYPVTNAETTLNSFREIGSVCYVLEDDRIKQKGLFATPEQALNFVHDLIDKAVEKDEYFNEIEIIGNGEVKTFNHEDFLRFDHELIETIERSQYALAEITEEILSKDFADCYVCFLVVSYENYGHAGYYIEKIANEYAEDYKENDRVNARKLKKIRIKNRSEKSLSEIIQQLKNKDNNLK